MKNDAILHSLSALVEPGTVVELRVPKAGRHGTVSGYFGNLESAARAAGDWSGKAPGVYWSINPVNPDLLARAVNRMQERAETATRDIDIVRRCYLYIDADPVRPAGICSTDAEHNTALQRVKDIRSFLIAQSVPESSIILADSGNGGTLYVRVKLPNEADALALINGVLAALDLFFSDGVVKVDRSVGNAARLARVPGTLNAKGDSTQDRAHRLARLLLVPEPIEICSREVLERIAGLVPTPGPKTKAGGQSYTGPTFEFQAWLEFSGLEIALEKVWGQATLYELETCPWNPDHRRTARIVRFDSGALSAGCFHDSCHGKGWGELRTAVGGHDLHQHAAAGGLQGITVTLDRVQREKVT